MKGYTTNKPEDGWPDIFVEVEKDGIAICKNSTADLWYGIEDFKIYLEANGFQYSVEEL